MTCQADCFRDGAPIRPIKAPNRLVWLYFEVQDEPPGTLEQRRFSHCECGCGNLIANPPYGKDQAPSLFPRPVLPEPITEPMVAEMSLRTHWILRILALLVIALMWYSTRR